jgi:hypothetical protein
MTRAVVLIALLAGCLDVEDPNDLDESEVESAATVEEPPSEVITRTDPVLTSGVPVSGLYGSYSSKQYFQITVPAGKELRIWLTGGSGDADLFVRRGERPTLTTYYCGSKNGGTTESCIFTVLGGDYHIMVYGYTSFSNVTLSATVI